jgi:uncharacterized membrane protein/2-hydroxychromene-2-carboxylate isomerase
MGSWHVTHVIRLAALTALAASAALLVDYLQPDPRFCGFHASCEQVLFSWYGRILGLPLPLVGIAAFGAIFAMSLHPALQAGRLFRALALAGGAVGLVLILLQVFVIGQLCPYCLAVDVSALVIAAAAVYAPGSTAMPALSRRGRRVWVASAAVLVGCAAVVASAGSWKTGTGQGPVPPEVSAHWVPGKVNVVEVADFQCPHCRRLHAVLMAFLREEGDRVHFVRLTAPMPAHAQARGASRAILCAEQQGKGDAVAEALFASSDLRPEACAQLAAAAGVSPGEFRACTSDPATDQRLDADVAWVQVASPRGLPVVWVQDRMLFGEQSIEALRDAAEEAEEHLRAQAP